MHILIIVEDFILFVWACVDTNRRRASATHTEAVKIAEEMLAGMERRGMIPPQGFQQPVQQPMQSYQPPRQSYQPYSAYQPYSPHNQPQVPPNVGNGNVRASAADESLYAASTAGEPSGLIPPQTEAAHLSENGAGPSNTGPAHHSHEAAGGAV